MYPIKKELKWMLMITSATLCVFTNLNAQMLQLPDGGVNFKSMVGRRIGVTDIEIKWDAPGVKGREGKIWGTSVAPYGFTVLGFGSTVESPWRAGANECTTISVSTDAMINGKKLPAGKYAFFIALYNDSCTLIFNTNTKEWGSYFYNKELDVLRLSVKQQKNMPSNKERLEYTFTNQTDHSVEVALEWEKWRIPFTIEVDLKSTTLASIRNQLTSGMGFDPPSLEAGAKWCLANDINLDEAINWINSATDPNLGGVSSFNALSTKAGLLNKIGKKSEADQIMLNALENASVTEMHFYGRQLIAQNKGKEALTIFEKNYKKFNGIWPTNAGMMRGYSATGDLKKALQYAKAALPKAPNPESKRVIEDAISTLESGKSLQ